MRRARAVRVGLHRYRTDPLLPQRDGVNLAHENITALLDSARGPSLEVAFHDLRALLTDLQHAREALADCRFVVSNVGPHAHYYFWLRERLGLDFAIVRDLRTALWSSYLFQEHLCAPLLREGDVLLVASHYTRAVYEHLFPHLRTLPVLYCYPLTVGFPPRPERAPRPRGAARTLGYLGRLSEDKNFPDLVELAIALNRAGGERWRLVACGARHSESCAPEAVAERFRRTLGPGDWFEWLPPRPNGAIWEVLARFDLMAFPSTSNLETLGRVLVEASHAAVPVVAADHAAAPELLPSESLCPVHYQTGTWLSCHFDHRLGAVAVPELVAAVARRPPASSCAADFAAHPARFLHLLEDPGDALAATPPLALTASQRALVDAFEVALPPPLDREAALATIAALVPWFLDLQRRGSDAWRARRAELLRLSRAPQRTRRYLAKSTQTGCDFTDVGGIDIELCHVAGFDPRFRLRPGALAPQARASNSNRLPSGSRA